MLCSSLILLFANSVCSQESERGFFNTKDETATSDNVSAIIIGVSKYQNLPDDQQLMFADKDAKAFADLLKSLLGNNQKNFQTFYNDQASSEIVKLNLYKLLLKNSIKGDMVFIYFAGHGDIDREIDDGFLLFHDVTRDGDYYISDAIRVSELKDLISGAVNRGVKVFLITDACRSGKLAGTKEGAKYTLQSLVNEWENTLKLVSCQPDQFSYEGKKWGNGAGVFTFYLINGIKGLADENSDEIISFGELYDYVKDNVKNDTELKQIPKASGNEMVHLFSVDSALKESARIAVQDVKESNKAQSRGFSILDDTTQFYHPLLDSFNLELTNESYLDSIYFVDDYGGLITIDSAEKLSRIDKDIKLVTIDSRAEYIALVSRKNIIKIFDINNQDLLQEYTKVKENISFIEFGFIPNTIVFGTMNNDFFIYDWIQNKIIRKLKKVHRRTLTQLQYNKSNNYFYTCGDDSFIKVWNTKKRKPIDVLKGHSATITDILIDSSRNVLISGSKDRSLIIWDLYTNTLIKRLSNPTSPILDITISSKGNSMAVLCKNAEILIYDLDSYELVGKKKLASTRRISTIGSLHKYLFVSGSSDTIQIVSYSIDSTHKLPIKPKSKNFLLKFFSDLSCVYQIDKKGNVLKSRMKLPILKSSASSTLETILDCPDIPDLIKEDAKTKLYTSIMASTQKIINPIILGKEILPRNNEILIAIRRLEYAIELYASNKEVQQRAIIYMKFLQAFHILSINDFENYYKVEELINEIIEIEPLAAFTYNTLCLLELKNRNYQLAKENALKAISHSPNWTEPRNNLGKVLISEGNYPEAIDVYNEIIEIKPDISKGYSGLGNLYTKIGDYSNAESYYLDGISVDTNNPYIYAKLAELELHRGQINSSQSYIELSKMIDSVYSFSETNLAKLSLYKFINQNRDYSFLSKAEYHFDIAIEQDPYNPDVYLDLADFYLQLVDIDDLTSNKFLNNNFFDKKVSKEEIVNKTIEVIIQLTETALEYDPNSLRSIALQGMAKVHINNDEGVQAFYINTISKYPNNFIVLYEYARYLERIGQFFPAIKYYKQSIQMNSKYLEAYLSLWNLLIKLNDDEQLLELFEQAKIQFPNSPVFYYCIAVKSDTISLSSIKKSINADTKYMPAVKTYENLKFLDYNIQLESNSQEPIGNSPSRAIYFKPDHILVSTNDTSDNIKYGLMNLNGRLTLTMDYDTIISINDTLVLAFSKKDNPTLSWHNLNENGKLINFKSVNSAKFFQHNKIIQISNRSYFGCIDYQGKTVLSMSFRAEIFEFSNGLPLLIVQKNIQGIRKEGCYNLEGEMIVPVIYDRVHQGSYYGIDAINASKDGDQYWFNENGDEIKHYLYD